MLHRGPTFLLAVLWLCLPTRYCRGQCMPFELLRGFIKQQIFFSIHYHVEIASSITRDRFQTLSLTPYTLGMPLDGVCHVQHTSCLLTAGLGSASPNRTEAPGSSPARQQPSSSDERNVPVAARPSSSAQEGRLPRAFGSNVALSTLEESSHETALQVTTATCVLVL